MFFLYSVYLGLTLFVPQIFFNGDSHVTLKMLKAGQAALPETDRRFMAELSIAELTWIECKCKARQVQYIQAEWPELRFTNFTMNGADDVVKYSKWRSATANQRQIAMGRPGSTQRMMAGLTITYYHVCITRPEQFMNVH